MSRKSKTYIIDGDKLIDLLARQQVAKDIAPTTLEWIAATNMPQRTAYNNFNKRIEEIKKEVSK